MVRTYLSHLREQHNETQQDVADSVGITRQYYQQIEAGTRQKKMDMTLLVKLADHFNVSITKMADMENSCELTN